MTTTEIDEKIYQEAKKRVKAKKDFYSHLGTWILVNIILIIVWSLSGQGYPWFLWPLSIWGAFVLLNFINVFFLSTKSDIGAIEKEVEKIKREN